MLGNILELEAGMVGHSQAADNLAGGLFLDLAKTFPSMPHEWIVHVLRQMRGPRTRIRLDLALHHNLLSAIIHNAWNTTARHIWPVEEFMFCRLLARGRQSQFASCTDPRVDDIARWSGVACRRAHSLSELARDGSHEHPLA